jgi:hypothetical protein
MHQENQWGVIDYQDSFVCQEYQNAAWRRKPLQMDELCLRYR